jgi:hypothetical protein
MQGLLRFWEAEVASVRLGLVASEFNALNRPSSEGDAGKVLSHLHEIDHNEFDSLRYVTNVSHLVYGTTLLDSFLSDTTMFLFLKFPHAMGKNQQVPLRVLINSASRNAAISKAAADRTREISYVPFVGRIDFLREAFGLDISLSVEAIGALEHYSSIRNIAVHDQGFIQLQLDESGEVAVSRKACPRHPTPVSWEDVHKAIKNYAYVAKAVAEAVFAQVLKESDHPAVQRFLKAISKNESLSRDAENSTVVERTDLHEADSQAAKPEGIQ